MKLHDAVNRDGLFDYLGRLWHATDSWVSHAAADRDLAYQALQAMAGAALFDADEAPAEAAAPRRRGLEASAGGPLGDLLADAARIARAAYRGEFNAPASTEAALSEIVRQMEDGDDYLAAPTVSVSVTPGTNSGDAALIASLRRSDGRDNYFASAAQITARHDGALRLTGPAAIPAGDIDWPGGTSLRGRNLAALAHTAGLIDGAMTEDSQGLPSGWITDGTGWSLLKPPQDTISADATPTGGWWAIRWTTHDGRTLQTATLSPTATASAVAAALRDVDELDQITVSGSMSAGYVVTFEGCPGGVASLAVVDELTGANLAVTRTRAGDPGVWLGTALDLAGDGTATPGFWHPLPRPTEASRYLGLARLYADAATTGTLEMGIYDSPTAGASAVSDAAGNLQRTVIDLSTITAETFDTINQPLIVPADRDCWLGLRITTAIAAGKHLRINWPQLLAPSVDLADGPAIWLLRGRWGPETGDSWTLDVTNDHAGKVLSWWLRSFGATAPMPPTSGSNLIPDSVIAP